MKAIRKHRRLGAATRTIALMLTLIMLFTALPVSNALGEDLFQGNDDSYVGSDDNNDGGDFSTDVTALHESDADELAQQTFELTPDDGVTVTLSGMMPVDGYAEAKTASVSEADVLHAYDITIYYRYGKEFEPDEDTPISVSFQSEAIADAIDNKAVSLEAEHIADDGKTESVDLISADNGEAKFEADSFSIYVIKYHEDDEDATYSVTPRITYHFLDPSYVIHGEGASLYYAAPEYRFPNKHNEMVTTQIIRSGDELQEVVIPDNKDAGSFFGWYKVDYISTGSDGVHYKWPADPQSNRQAFNETITIDSSVHKDQDVYLAPLFDHYRFLTFHQDVENGPNKNMIIARKLVVLNDDKEATIKISDVRAPSSDPNRIVFWGWKFDHSKVTGDRYGMDEQGEGDQIQIERTVNDDDSEVDKTITIKDTHEISGVQPSAEDLSKMIYDIWPEFREARWFYFDTGGNGAEYTPARFVMVGEEKDSLSGSIPRKDGYTFGGWFCKVERGGQIYDVRVSDPLNSFQAVDLNPDDYPDGDGDENKLSLNPGVWIEKKSPTKKVLKMEKPAEGQGELTEQYFYAKWNSKYQADYRVIIWKQKDTDRIGISEEDKTYDFGENHDVKNVLLYEHPYANDPDLIGQYTNMGYEGFEYKASKTKVVNGLGTTGDDANKINPDGSTVVNIYYDRIPMKMTFYYRSGNISTSSSVSAGNDIYVTTQNNARQPQYGKVGSDFVQLTATENKTATFVYPYKYTTPSSDTAVMFGVDNDEYVKLDSKEICTWIKRGTKYTPTAITTVNSTTYTKKQYVLYNGTFDTLYNLRSSNKVYFYNKKWYRTRSYSGGRYTYSNEITEAYTSSSYTAGDAYTDTRYVINSYEMAETTSNSGTQYGVDASGNYYTLQKSSANYEYYLNGEPYTDPKYSRTNDSTVHSGTVYKKDDNGAFTALSESEKIEYNGTIYAQRNGNAPFEEVTRSIDISYTWEANDTVYTGTRYLKFTRTGNSTYPYKEVWEGLYNQKLSLYHYNFPDGFKWNEQSDGSGIQQTLLDSFYIKKDNVLATDYSLYSQNDAPSGMINHLRQKLDGTYSNTEASHYDVARVTTGQFTFYFSDKFQGFKVSTFATSFDANGTGAPAVPGQSSTFNTTTNPSYYIYHTRNESTLTFDDNYTGGGQFDLNNVKYEQPLKAYEDAYIPKRDHYTFTGWYEDITCTQRFNFEKETMPNANKIIYAGWAPERYLVTVDADGGDMDLGGTFSTYFRINYNEMVDEYAGIRKNYIEDPDGDYLYLDFSYDKIMEIAENYTHETNPKLIDENGNVNFPGALRKSFYLLKDDLSSFINSSSNVTVGDQSYCYKDYFTPGEIQSFIKTDGTQRISYTQKPGEYALYAWYKVIDDQGNTEPTPYNFTNRVEEDLHLKAKWVQVGKYSFAYDPTMSGTGITGNMARYNDPLERDRYYVDGASAVILQAPTNLRSGGSTSGDVDASNYIFRGWRIVDEDHKPLEGNIFYNPGDTIEVNARLARGESNVIHMEAYYERKDSTVRRVDDTSLTLYANKTDSGTGVVNREGLAEDKHEYADLTAKKLVLDRQQNNVAVKLSDYSKNFSNTAHYQLIGWDRSQESHDFIPDYYTDAVIGVDNKDLQDNPLPNELYAVWEPMVYLTLNNDTSKDVAFTLTFKGASDSPYTGQTNVVEEHLRTLFEQIDSTIASVTKTSDGVYTVTLKSKKEVKLAIPEGKDYTYTVSGNYATGNNASNLFIYNSGDANNVSIEQNSSTGKWYHKYGSTTTQVSGNSVSYTTTGTLTESAQGHYVMFSESDPTTTLQVKTAYYDNQAQSPQWVESTPSTGPKVTPGFNLPSGSDAGNNKVKLINNNASVKFGLKVDDTTEAYKFIGWYSTTDNTVIPAPKPNDPTVDGAIEGFGLQNPTNLSVPLHDTTYYALYVPYANDSLKIKHILKSGSAGTCADSNGLMLTVNEVSDSGDKDDPVEISVAVNEQNGTVTVNNQALPSTFTVKVGAREADPGIFDAIYLGDNKIGNDSIVDDTTTGYHEYTDTAFSLNKLLTPSDSVKGLMELKDVVFSSEFSLGYKITYRYTARDGVSKDYIRTGRLPSYDEAKFREFVIENTPYTRTLAGDTVWDTDRLEIKNENGNVTALLTEVPGVRDVCRVTIKNADGVNEAYETVPYGHTFTADQEAKHIAPAQNNQGLKFDHWKIDRVIGTETIHVSDCYFREFHFAVWNDYVITPIYSANPTGDPTSAWRNVTIDYIDTSRNQWHKDTVNADEFNNDPLIDKVVADMDIAFNDGTNLILESFDDNGVNAYQLGVIFEQIGTTDENGNFDKNNYQGSENDVTVKKRVRAVLGQPANKSSGTATDYYYSNGNGNQKSGYYYTRIDINEDTVSNFNRSEFARSFNTANVKNKVFRVYAYMVLPGAGDDSNIADDEIVISAPYYMTMYKYANNDLAIDHE